MGQRVVIRAPFDFQADFTYGREGELYGMAVGAALAEGEPHVEFKRKMRVDLKFYIETEQRSLHGRGPWVPSGISVYDGPLFAFVIADTGVVLSFPAESIRKAVRLGFGASVDQPTGHNGNPTRGRLIHLYDLLALRPWLQSFEICEICAGSGRAALAHHCPTGGEHLTNYHFRCEEHGT
jgi:hypothetical protein